MFFILFRDVNHTVKAKNVKTLIKLENLIFTSSLLAGTELGCRPLGAKVDDSLANLHTYIRSRECPFRYLDKTVNTN